MMKSVLIYSTIRILSVIIAVYLRITRKGYKVRLILHLNKVKCVITVVIFQYF